MIFGEEAADIMFNKIQSAIILLVNDNLNKSDEYSKLMKNITDKINYKLKVIMSNIKDLMSQKLAEYLNIK